MLKPKIKTLKPIQRVFVLVVPLVLLAAGLLAVITRQQNTLAATNSTINFQARLLTAAGNVVPDGLYNVEFKLYNAVSSGGSSQGSCSGDANCVWTETRTGSNKVTVRNGYLTVNLGSVTAFSGAINWDQGLWLTMNIGGTGSPVWDGEMNPRLKLTAVPFAFRAGALVSSDGTSVVTAGNESGTICVQNSANCGFVQGSAGDFIQNQPGSDQSANFWIDGNGKAQEFQAARFDTVDAGALTIGGTNATAINLNQDTTIGAGKSLVVTSGSATITGGTSGDALVVSNSTSTGNIALFKDNDTTVLTLADGGAATFQNSSNSNFGLQILSAGGSGIFRVDTLTRKVAIGAYSMTAADNITGQLDILPANDTRIGLSIKGFSPTYNTNYIQVQDSSGGNIFRLQANGNIQTASGVFMSNSQSAASTNSSAASFKTGDVSGTASNSGIATFKSGDSTTSGNSGGVNVTSGNATLGNSGSVTIDVGTASGTKGQIFVGTSNASSITIGNATNNSPISLNSGTGSINIGAGAQARSINIGTGAAAQTIVIGSQNSTGSVTVQSGSGGTTFQSSDVSNAFRILNAGSTMVFGVDTFNSRVRIGHTSDDTTGTLLVLDTKTDAGDPTGVNGAMYYNSSTNKFRCYQNNTWSDCITASGGFVVMQNTYTNSTGGSIPEIILDSTRGALDIQDRSASNGGTIGANLLNVRASAANDSTLGAAVFSVGNTGAVTSQNTTNSANAFRIMDSNSNEIVGVNTSEEIVRLLGNNTGHLNTFTSQTGIGTPARQGSVTAVVNGYIYIIGGCSTGSGTPTGTTYYAKLNSDGSVGTWNTTTALEGSFCRASVTTYNGYIYMKQTDSTQLYYAKPNANGTITSWTYMATRNANGTLISAASNSASIVAYNGYMYYANNATSNVYYSPIHSDGTVGVTSLAGTFNSTDVFSGTSRSFGTMAIYNGYLYMISSSVDAKVYYAKILPDGSVGTAVEDTNSPVNDGAPSSDIRSYTTAQIMNGYLYIMGGENGGSNSLSDVLYAPLMSTGEVGAWVKDSTSLPGNRSRYGIASANGFIYVLNGWDSATGANANVWYSSVPRVQVGGGLDLTAYDAAGNVETGARGSLTAGNTTVSSLTTGDARVAGSLGVDGGVNLMSGLRVIGATNVQLKEDADGFNVANQSGISVLYVDKFGATVTDIDLNMFRGDIYSQTNSTAALNITTSSDHPSGAGHNLLTVDTTNGKVQIGASYPGALLVLGSGSADIGGTNGAMYYNSTSGKFRCYENGAWYNCLSGLNNAVTVQATQADGSNGGGSTAGYTAPTSVNSTTFIAPPSGKVMLYWIGESQGPGNSYVRLSPEVRTGSVVGSGTVVSAPDDAISSIQWGSTTGRATASHLLSGLTPGNTYNVRILWKTGTASANYMNKQSMQIVPVW